MTTILRAPEVNYNYSASFNIAILACAHCSVPFGITVAFQERREEDHASFYCPNGHANVYRGDNTEEKLRKEVERLKRQSQWRLDQMDAARNDAELQRRKAAARKGVITKMKTRIANGVCPVPKCKRSGLGADVVAHILTCHPGFHVDE